MDILLGMVVGFGLLLIILLILFIVLMIKRPARIKKDEAMSNINSIKSQVTGKRRSSSARQK